MPRTPLLWAVAAAVVVFGASVVARCQDDAIDWARARALHQRVLRGEKLTAEEQAYHDRAARALAARGGRGSAPSPRESTGLVPLTDLADGKYKGETGGLYGGGKNEPPPADLALAMKAAKAVVPLSADGRPAPDGRIVLLSMGMSNTTQEFSRFKQLADQSPQKSARLVVVDGAQGGQAADQWLDPDTNSRAKQVWGTVEVRLRSVGVTDQQVQVVWIKQALIQQGQFGEFPAHAKHLQASLEKNIVEAKRRFPNLKLAYLSSRIYGGYATTALNPEPYAYEGAYAVRWAIQRQIDGAAELNGDPSRGAVKAPVLLWGPYLWADGVKGRKADSLVWAREDLRANDGTHPSESGRQKVADLLMRFFTTDRTARPWFTLDAAAARLGYR